MNLRFRNLDVTPDAPVASWPTEGVLAALQRGSLHDWRRLMTAIHDDPWGPLARRVRALVTASGLTQSAFAEAIGTSASRLSTYLSGEGGARLVTAGSHGARRAR
jgi:hypothetical protein